MLLKCDTVPRPTHKSSSFVKGIPISGGEGTAKRSSVSFTQGFASSTAGSARENTARASRGNRSPRAGSYGCGRGDILDSEALHRGGGAEGDPNKTLSSPFPGALNPGMSRSLWG